MKFTILTATLSLATAASNVMRAVDRKALRTQIADLKEHLKLASFGYPVVFTGKEYKSFKNAYEIRWRGFGYDMLFNKGSNTGLQIPYHVEKIDVSPKTLKRMSEKIAQGHQFMLGLLKETEVPNGRDAIEFTAKIHRLHKDRDIEGKEYWFGNCHLSHPGMYKYTSDGIKYLHFEVVFKIEDGVFEVADHHLIRRMPGRYYQEGKFITCKKEEDPATWNPVRNVTFWGKLQEPKRYSSGYMIWNMDVVKTIDGNRGRMTADLKKLTDTLKKMEDDVKIEVIKDETNMCHGVAGLIVDFAEAEATTTDSPERKYCEAKGSVSQETSRGSEDSFFYYSDSEGDVRTHSSRVKTQAKSLDSSVERKKSHIETLKKELATDDVTKDLSKRARKEKLNTLRVLEKKINAF